MTKTSKSLLGAVGAGVVTAVIMLTVPIAPKHQSYFRWDYYSQADLNACWFEIGVKTNITDTNWTILATVTGTNQWPIKMDQPQMFYMLLRVVNKEVPWLFWIHWSYTNQYYKEHPKHEKIQIYGKT